MDHEEAVITIGNDKTLRVWAKRTSGQFWPTICHMMPAGCSALEYHGESRRIFVGLSNGQIHEFDLSEDINRISPKRTINAHSNGIMCVRFAPKHNWILTTSKDKTFLWHCLKTGRKIGSFEAKAWCTAVEYDSESEYAFVADYSGMINVLKLSDSGHSHITTLQGHQNSIRTMAWDQERRLLFSGGFDKVIVIWDIGSRQGSAYELTGHMTTVTALAYSRASHKLISCSEDGQIGIWEIAVERKETSEWGESNQCEKCGTPFFWNVKGMWQMKQLGGRQHHCRKCGRALCATCSAQESTFPPMGFEVPVRMCQECTDTISTEDRSPMASFTSIKPIVCRATLNEKKDFFVGVHTDDTVRLWDLGALVQ